MLMQTDPFRDLDRLTQQVFGTSARPVVMPMDAWREGDPFLVEFDVPGMDPDSMDLDVERNVVTVNAERPRLDDERQMIAAERTRGVFSRQVFLGDNLDTEQIDAQLHRRRAAADHPGRRTGQAPQDLDQHRRAATGSHHGLTAHRARAGNGATGGGTPTMPPPEPRPTRENDSTTGIWGEVDDPEHDRHDDGRTRTDPAADQQRLCAEVDRILTAAYTRIVADAVALRRTRPLLTTTTAHPPTDQPHGQHTVSAPHRHRRGRSVFANQRAPPHPRSGAEPTLDTFDKKEVIPHHPTDHRHIRYTEPVPTPHRDTRRRTHTPRFRAPNRRTPPDVAGSRCRVGARRRSAPARRTAADTPISDASSFAR